MRYQSIKYSGRAAHDTRTSPSIRCQSRYSTADAVQDAYGFEESNEEFSTTNALTFAAYTLTSTATASGPNQNRCLRNRRVVLVRQ